MLIIYSELEMLHTDPPVIAAIFEGILIIQFVQPFSTLHEWKFSAKTDFLFPVMFIQRPSRPETEEIIINIQLITDRVIPVQTS